MTAPVDRVRQLIALAGSSNENEARNAAAKACAMIREHRLELREPGTRADGQRPIPGTGRSPFGGTAESARTTEDIFNEYVARQYQQRARVWSTSAPGGPHDPFAPSSRPNRRSRAEVEALRRSLGPFAMRERNGYRPGSAECPICGGTVTGHESWPGSVPHANGVRILLATDNAGNVYHRSCAGDVADWKPPETATRRGVPLRGPYTFDPGIPAVFCDVCDERVAVGEAWVGDMTFLLHRECIPEADRPPRPA